MKRTLIPAKSVRTAVVRVLLLATITAIASPGCVRRRMTIRTNPPGALVFVDDIEVGTTPVSPEFTYYGTRKIQVFKDGYETQTIKQAFRAPWYEWPVLEFFSENLWPGELDDEHVVNLQLQPQPIVPADRLLGRAQQLRGDASQGYAPALPNATNTPQPVTPLPPPADYPGAELVPADCTGRVSP